jgi:hypothetical protein
VRGEGGLSSINALPPQPKGLQPKGLLRRYLDRRNRYIVERRLPRFSERPFDWSTNLSHTLLYRFGFGHLGKLAVVAAYFILTQTLTGQHTTIGSWSVTLPDVKGSWDHLLSRNVAHGGLVPVMSQHAWDPLRHLIRAVYEGIFGILLFKQIGYSVLKAQAKDDGEASAVDQFITRFMPFVANRHQGHQITPLQYLALPLVVTVAAVPGVAIGYGILYGLQHLVHASWLSPHLSAHPSFAARFYADHYGAVFIGVFAGLTRFVSYVTNPVLHSNTVYFARRRVAKGKKGAWWHPPAYRLLVDDLARHAGAQQRARAALDARSSVATRFLVGGWIVVIALAAYGYYVIRYIA